MKLLQLAFATNSRLPYADTEKLGKLEKMKFLGQPAWLTVALETLVDVDD